MNSVILGRKQLHLLWSTANIPFDHKISACSWNRPTIKICNASWEAKWVGVCFEKKTEKNLYASCNIPCVRFSQWRANCRWEGLQHEKFCPASCVTIAGDQFAFIWSWVDRIFAVCCLQRLPELLPRDENATPPIPENRAHGLVGLYGKRMERNLSLFRPLGQIYQ